MRLAQSHMVTAERERAEAWAVLWDTLKVVYPLPLEELHKLIPCYKAARRPRVVLGKEYLFGPFPGRVDSLWDYLEIGWRDEVDDPERRLARLVALWQRRWRLGGYTAFRETLRLLNGWAKEGRAPRMPVYHFTEAFPVFTTPPAPPPYEPYRQTYEEYLEEIKEYMNKVERLAEQQFNYRRLKGRHKLEDHFCWFTDILHLCPHRYFCCVKIGT